VGAGGLALLGSVSRHELFGLTSQLRRAAVLVPANFAEGFKKRGKADKARFYNTAQGSLEECRYYLILAQDLGYGETTELKKD
jgi:four helix bundle protein